MKDLKDFFDTPGLLHIGEQIVKYFGVNDFWNLRQVNKYWKNVADNGLKKIKARYESSLLGQIMRPFNWRTNQEFWAKRGALNYIRFHEFFEKWYKENEHRIRSVHDLLDKDWKYCR